MTMQILDSLSDNPYVNIATEEYLLKQTEKDFVFIYTNEPSIIIGKHQNAYAEINLPYVLENRIPLVRRISGGGTVWHDPGNVNFSFIMNGQQGNLVNFRRYATPVLSYLHSLKVPAVFGSRNEILVNGWKISGNAEHVCRSRVIHHGTLLFSSDLRALASALSTMPGKYKDRAVKSVPGRVANIVDFLEPGTSISEFRNGLIVHLSEYFEGSARYTLSGTDTAGVNELVSRKYSTWEWNIGYSPRYSMTRKIDWDGKEAWIQLEVEKGKIVEINIKSDDTDHALFGGISRALSGADHEPGQVHERISASGLVNPRLIDYFVDSIF